MTEENVKPFVFEEYLAQCEEDEYTLKCAIIVTDTTKPINGPSRRTTSKLQQAVADYTKRLLGRMLVTPTNTEIMRQVRGACLAEAAQLHKVTAKQIENACTQVVRWMTIDERNSDECVWIARNIAKLFGFAKAECTITWDNQLKSAPDADGRLVGTV